MEKIILNGKIAPHKKLNAGYVVFWKFLYTCMKEKQKKKPWKCEIFNQHLLKI